MRKALVLLPLVALAGLAAVAAWPKDEPRSLTLWVEKPKTVLALEWKRDVPYLVRADARTLRPKRGASLPLSGHWLGPSFSPDGKLLAVGSDGFGDVWLVDTRRLRVVGTIQAEEYGTVLETAWAGGKLVAVVDRCCRDETTEGLTVAVLDAARRAPISGHRIDGSLHAAAQTSSGLVLVLGPRGRLGTARLAFADAEGGPDIVALERIAAGSEWGDGHPIGRAVTPGVAVDKAGHRAFVVGAGTPVAEVDLDTLAVKYHHLTTPVSLLGRVHDWLEPAAEAKAPPNGPQRFARWLGNGYLAVWGVDNESWADAQGGEHWRQTSVGVKLIDTRDWSVRMLDPQASALAVAERTLLTFGALSDSDRPKMAGVGLRAYLADGTRRFQRFGAAPLDAVHVVGSRAFVADRQRSYAVLDTQTGRALRRIKGTIPKPLLR
ncbi:MAG TPA: hypothetical protein VFL41_07510 [Gaiellaceae bacterium]|nr:hypothetical protein [Gaiellaceae bacterium]